MKKSKWAWLMVVFLLAGCAAFRTNPAAPDQKVLLYEQIALYFADARIVVVALGASGKCSQQDLANVKLAYNGLALVFRRGGEALKDSISGKSSPAEASASIHSLIQIAAQIAVASSTLPPGPLAQTMAVVSAVATQVEIQFAKIDQTSLQSLTVDQQAALINRINNAQMFVQFLNSASEEVKP